MRTPLDDCFKDFYFIVSNVLYEEISFRTSLQQVLCEIAVFHSWLKSLKSSIEIIHILVDFHARSLQV